MTVGLNTGTDPRSRDKASFNPQIGEAATRDEGLAAGDQPSASGQPSAPATKSPAPICPPGGKPVACPPAPPAKKPAVKKPAPAPKPPRQLAPPSGAGDELAQKLLVHINAKRAAEKPPLPPYTMLAGTVTAAAKHNDVMAGSCGMSHRCPGEADLGDRIGAEGVRWSSLGENVGYGGAVSGDAATLKMAVSLTDSMLAETPPNDGHRKNLLSSGFTHIGIAILRDSKGMVWLTQDFSSS